MMLSLFPELFDFSWYVPLLFRMFLAIYLLRLGHTHVLQAEKAAHGERIALGLLGGILMTIGVGFLIGLYTQLAGAIGFSFTLLALFLKKKHSSYTTESSAFYVLAGLVSLSLIFLGPGPFAFDLPL